MGQHEGPDIAGREGGVSYETILRTRVTDERVSSYVSTWPEKLQDAFWAATAAPTASESAFLTLAFATALAHELAEKIRAHTAADYQHVISAYGWAYANGWKSGRDRAAELIEKGEIE